MRHIPPVVIIVTAVVLLCLWWRASVIGPHAFNGTDDAK